MDSAPLCDSFTAMSSVASCSVFMGLSQRSCSKDSSREVMQSGPDSSAPSSSCSEAAATAGPASSAPASSISLEVPQELRGLSVLRSCVRMSPTLPSNSVMRRSASSAQCSILVCISCRPSRFSPKDALSLLSANADARKPLATDKNLSFTAAEPSKLASNSSSASATRRAADALSSDSSSSSGIESKVSKKKGNSSKSFRHKSSASLAFICLRSSTASCMTLMTVVSRMTLLAA
mmetsp:Transcript_4519/g.8247  ORF Transcript_4519/g.8247 Transcript_4519/m.8247 type:complete len:235 (+) Transcript_4519:2621-3325(+)